MLRVSPEKEGSQGKAIDRELGCGSAGSVQNHKREKLRGSGCLALSSPPRLGSTSALPVLSVPLAMGWSSQRGDRHKADPESWGCAALLTTDGDFKFIENVQKPVTGGGEKKTNNPPLSAALPQRRVLSRGAAPGKNVIGKKLGKK